MEYFLNGIFGYPLYYETKKKQLLRLPSHKGLDVLAGNNKVFTF